MATALRDLTMLPDTDSYTHFPDPESTNPKKFEEFEKHLDRVRYNTAWRRANVRSPSPSLSAASLPLIGSKENLRYLVSSDDSMDGFFEIAEQKEPSALEKVVGAIKDLLPPSPKIPAHALVV